MTCKVIDEFLEELKKFGVRKAARLSGIHEQTLYTWTQKRREPRLSTAQKVANIMGLEFLLFDKLEDE